MRNIICVSVNLSVDVIFLHLIHSTVLLITLKQLEDFEKVKVLGVGGTGIVYELLHKSNGSRFAMKVCACISLMKCQRSCRCFCFHPCCFVR